MLPVSDGVADNDGWDSVRQACIEVVPKNPANFNVDNVRVVKITGGGAHDSRVVKGVVIKRGTEGSIHDVTDAKVAVFAQGVDTASTETKVPRRAINCHAQLNACCKFLTVTPLP